MAENRNVLITDFLIKNKHLLNISGIEKASGSSSRYWAKFMGGCASPKYSNENGGGGGGATITLCVLNELYRDLDKLLKDSDFVLYKNLRH